MNASIRKLFFVTVALFVALLATLAWWQVVQARNLADMPGNSRQVYAQLEIERGLILASDKSELAGNRQEGDFFYRVYPAGDLAASVVGYNDDRYGRTGIERSLNSYLTGTADEVELVNFFDTLLGRAKKGADVRLTINAGVQRTALDELREAGGTGAIVVMDVQTGAVTAMASNPSYDPSQLQANWAAWQTDPAAPLLNRATMGQYTPGSTLKLITTAAALESGSFTPASQFKDDSGSIEIGGNTIRNWRATPFGAHDFTEAFAQSINTTYAQVGDQLGAERLFEYQKKFGFYEKPPIELPADEVLASGRYVNGELSDSSQGMDRVAVAWMAVGQENMLVTPLQMAMVAQAIGNDGKMMKPYLVDSISDYNGTILKQTRPEEWKQPISQATAAALTGMMIETVNDGTGSQARTSKVQIAAKTGTAEVVTDELYNAWFVGFAPADNPRYAIAVVIAGADKSGAIASRVARDTLLSALGL